MKTTTLGAFRLAVVGAAAVLAAGSIARATVYSWEWASGGGNWNTPSRWNPDGHPRADDEARVVNGGAGDVTVYYYSDYPPEELSEVWVYAVGAGDMLLFASSGDALNAKFLSVGFAGPGAVDQRAGAFTFSSSVVLGNGKPGDYSTRGGSLTTPTLEVGFSAVGRFTHSGGAAVEVTDARTVGDPTGNSYYDIDGGTLTAGTLTVGIVDVLNHGGPGTFNQTGGTVNIGADLRIGDEAAGLEQGEGWYTLTNAGATLDVSGTTFVGDEGDGTFAHSAGTHTTDQLILGSAATGVGSYTLSGVGELTVDDEAFIGLNGTGSFLQTAGTNSTAQLHIGRNTVGEGTYEMQGGTLDTTNVYVGNVGTGTFTQSGGEHVVAADLRLGENQNGEGTYNLSGSAILTVTDEAFIGLNGTGSFLQTSGANETTHLHLGRNSTGEGTYEMQGGTLDTTYVYVGNFGTGTFTQSGGEHVVAANLSLGDDGAGEGTYNLSGSAILTVNGTSLVGKFGTGTFNHSGGNHNVIGELHVAAGAGAGQSHGEYNLSGGNLGTIDSYVGNFGIATFTHTGGWHHPLGNLYLGSGLAGSPSIRGEGTYVLSGAGNLLVDGNVYLGQYGAGTFTHSGGGSVIGDSLYLGYQKADGISAQGAYELSGTGDLHVLDYEYVGYEGIGTFTQSGGQNTTDKGLRIGSQTGGQGTYNLSGGTLLSKSHVYVGRSGTGAFNHSGGSLTVEGSLYCGRFTGAYGEYHLSAAGDLDVVGNTDVGRDGSADFDQTGGTHDVQGDLTVAYGANSQSTYNQSGGDLHVTGSLTVGYMGTGQFNLSDGTCQADGGLNLGVSGGGVGEYIVTGGTAGVPSTVAIRAGSMLNVQGGVFGANVIENNGTYRQSGGELVALTLNQASETGIQISGAALLQVDEINNATTFSLYGGTMRGRAAVEGLFNNAGTFNQYGGTFHDRLVNNGLFHHEGGTFAGFFEHRGLFTPAADFTAGAGIENHATLTVSPGRSIYADGAGLDNRGAVTMAGGILGGDGPVVNAGSLGGYGFISGTDELRNDGVMAVQGGLLNVTKDTFTNTGNLLMADAAAQLDGTALVNEGNLGGVGLVACDVTNRGTIEPVGGTLVVDGDLAHYPEGTLSVSTGNKLSVPGGLRDTRGFVSLAGGILETTTFTNDGQVAGYGVLRTGTLGNDGTMIFSGGSATIEGKVTNHNKIEVRYQPAVFTGDVTNKGDFKVTDTTVTFLGTYIEDGTYTSDPADNCFQDVSVGAGGAFIGGSGDRFFIRGDFLSQSAAATAWNTDRADLIFQQGGTRRHTMNVTSEDRGAVGAAWTDNFAWGRVSVEAGETVTLADAGAPGGALYTQNLALETGATLDAADLNLRLKAAPVNQGTVDMATGNLVVEYDGASPFEAIAEQLRSGLRDGPTGYWDGPGIHSSDAAADAQRITALGVIDNCDANPRIGGLTHLEGEPVSAESVLVKHTWFGDANLDGVVDTNDYDMINTAWLLWTAEGIVPDGGFRWAVGDFNYDGTIDTNDYDRINNAWLLSGGGVLSGAAPAPTPEPATLALLAAAGIVLLAPRRKRGDA